MRDFERNPAFGRNLVDFHQRQTAASGEISIFGVMLFRGPHKSAWRMAHVGGQWCWIRRRTNTVNGKIYHRFFLRQYVNGEEKKEHYSTEADAIARFDEIVREFKQPGETKTGQRLTEQERSDYEHARESASNIELTVNAAVARYQTLVEMLAPFGKTPEEAAVFYKDRLEKRDLVEPMLFSTACEMFLQPLRKMKAENQKKAGGEKGCALKASDRRKCSVLSRAAKTMDGYIENIQSEDIENWILAQGDIRSQNTVSDYLSALRQLFIFARKEKYLRRGEKTAAEGVSAADVFKRLCTRHPEHAKSDDLDDDDGECGMYSADECNKAMYWFKQKAEEADTEEERMEWLGWLFILAIRKFFGTRMTEIWKLLRHKKNLFNFDTKSIHITKKVSKTGEDRYLPIWPIVEEWLLFSGQANAIDVARKYRAEQLGSSFNEKLKAIPDWIFVRNGFRDSAASHLFNVFGKKTALDIAGHDFEIMLKHYQHAVTEEQGMLYFQCFIDPNDPRCDIDPRETVQKDFKISAPSLLN